MTEPQYTWESAVLNKVLCERRVEIHSEEIEQFRALMGYPPSPHGATAVAPTSMGLTYGLGLGWEHSVFPPGVVRMGDEDRFGVPVRAGDTLITTLRIIDRFTRKNRRFLKYEMVTRNQHKDLVC